MKPTHIELLVGGIHGEVYLGQCTSTRDRTTTDHQFTKCKPLPPTTVGNNGGWCRRMVPRRNPLPSSSSTSSPDRRKRNALCHSPNPYKCSTYRGHQEDPGNPHWHQEKSFHRPRSILPASCKPLGLCWDKRWSSTYDRQRRRWLGLGQQGGASGVASLYVAEL
jgi:hypothetical protein